MSHARSLRVIGQSLEAARISTFELEKYGPQYMVWTDSVTDAAEAILRNALRHNKAASQEARHSQVNRVFCFSPADISRLDAQAQKQRRNQSLSATPTAKLLSHGLRTLGDHFDRMQVNAFRVEWTMGSVSIHYQRVNGPSNCKTFTIEELQKLCAHPSLRRSGLYLFSPADA
jgi:hypothetical protein